MVKGLARLYGRRPPPRAADARAARPAARGSPPAGPAGPAPGRPVPTRRRGGRDRAGRRCCPTSSAGIGDGDAHAGRPPAARRPGAGDDRAVLRAPRAEAVDARGRPGAAAAAAARPAGDADRGDPRLGGRRSTASSPRSSPRCATCTPTTCCPRRSAARTAFLPFLVERCVDPPRRAPSTTSSPRWRRRWRTRRSCPTSRCCTGTARPVRRAVEANARPQAGSNPAASFARGLDALTIRPLLRSLPPDEDWVVVTYRGLDGVAREIRLDWQVARRRRRRRLGDGTGLGIAAPRRRRASTSRCGP